MGRKEKLSSSKIEISVAIFELAVVKKHDIIHRKFAKRSHKAKYTRDINKLTNIIELLKDAKRELRVIPLAVQ